MKIAQPLQISSRPIVVLTQYKDENLLVSIISYFLVVPFDYCESSSFDETQGVKK